jgi:LmbE family N-acetylglucosaminyl deacetylase
MNHPLEGFSTNPTEDSPLEMLRMSAINRELNNSGDRHVGRRSHPQPLPSMVEGAKVRFWRSPSSGGIESPSWQPGQSSESPIADDRQHAPSSALESRRSDNCERISASTSTVAEGISIDRPSSQIQTADREIDSSFLLANPESLPFRELSKIARHRVLVVAPHPDDETLGCGGAISLLRRKGYDVRVLVISDGTLSHPNSRKYPAHALQSIRARETQMALRILGVNKSAITFLGLKDGSIPTLTAANFPNAKALCQNYLRAARPDTIFLPWRFDPHPDHRATWQLLKAAMLGLGLTPQMLEYPIWDWDRQQQKKVPDLDRISGWRLDISAAVDRKLQAIGAYRSQLGLLIDDDPNGFCLTPELLTNFTRPWEVYFEETL